MKSTDIPEYHECYDEEPEVTISNTDAGPTAFIALEGIKGSTARFFRGPTPQYSPDPVIEQLRHNFPPHPHT